MTSRNFQMMFCQEMGKTETINWVAFCGFIKHTLYAAKWRAVNCLLLSTSGLSPFSNKNFINVLLPIEQDKNKQST